MTTFESVSMDKIKKIKLFIIQNDNLLQHRDVRAMIQDSKYNRFLEEKAVVCINRVQHWHSLD